MHHKAFRRLPFYPVGEALGLLTLPQRVIENENIRPVDIFFPVFGLGDEVVSDVTLFFIADEVANFVTFLGNLPGECR